MVACLGDKMAIFLRKKLVRLQRKLVRLIVYVYTPLGDLWVR